MSQKAAHETYIIHCWQEGQPSEASWRFRLTVVSSGRSYGFTSAEALMRFWQRQFSGQNDNSSCPPASTDGE